MPRLVCYGLGTRLTIDESGVMKARDNKRAKAARAASLLGVVRQSDNQPAPAETLAIGDDKKPRKHSPGSLTRGDSVWYRNERWYIECAPADWSESAHIRITDKPVIPNKEQDNHRTTFYVHADCVEIAPTRGTRYDKQTTFAQEERKVRAQAGQRDIGDEIAQMLRSASSLDDTYTIAARFLRVPEDELRQRYGHLNPGQQRMNLGNKMRHQLKKGAK